MTRASSSGPAIYHLEVTVGGCNSCITLNGFPLLPMENLDRPDPQRFAPPVNELLVGDDNVLELRAEATRLSSGLMSRFEDLIFKAQLRCFRKDASGNVPPGSDEVVASFTIPAEMVERNREEEIPLPVVIQHRFASQGPSYRDLFLGAAAWSNTEALLDYAMVLRDLLLARNAAGFASHFEAKLEAYQIGYAQDEEQPVAGFTRFLSQDLMPAKPQDFTREDIEPISWCEGRVWELRQKSGAPLVVTGQDDDGASYALPVFVASLDGRLQVVR